MSVSRSFELINPPAINILAVFLRYFPAFEEGEAFRSCIPSVREIQEIAFGSKNSREAGGWLTLRHEKILQSTAAFWVIVLVSHERKRNPFFLVVPPAELLRSLMADKGEASSYHFYPWILKQQPGGRPIALNGRGLDRHARAKLASGQVEPGARDLTSFLDAWAPLNALAAMA